MTISDPTQYFGAVQARERLTNMLEEGKKEFSGYGLELFERGMNRRLGEVKDEISRYETSTFSNDRVSAESCWIKAFKSETLSAVLSPTPPLRSDTFTATAASPSVLISRDVLHYKCQMLVRLGSAIQLTLFKPNEEQKPPTYSYAIGDPRPTLCMTTA